MSPADRKSRYRGWLPRRSRPNGTICRLFRPEAHPASAPGICLAEQITCPAGKLIESDERQVIAYICRFQCFCFQDGAGKSRMDDKTYLVRFKESGLSPVLVEAGKVEVHGEHLVFRLSSGELSALFLFEIVKDWSEIDI
jgi:hypothetical protein